MSKPKAIWNEEHAAYIIEDGIGGSVELLIEEAVAFAAFVNLRENPSPPPVEVILNETNF